MTFDPTDEQLRALNAFHTRADFVTEAGAGTGKTSTLELMARSTDLRGQYLAFNRAIVEDAGVRFPDNVSCNTAHSLAFQSVGKPFAHRLRSKRESSTWIARQLGVDPFIVRLGQAAKQLSPAFLAGLAMRSVTIFCQTADERPTCRHVPYLDGLDAPRPDGTRDYENNDAVAAHIEPYIIAAWADLSRPDGRLPYRHEHYLKLWQLSEPRIYADFVMFDEAQDASPVMAAIVGAQTQAQRIYVGDSQQAIYGFTGAINAMERLAGERVFLTQSFRFGDPIATLANRVLGRLGAKLRIVGTPSIPSMIGPVADPNVILCRTNAEAVRQILGALARGTTAHLVGGGAEIASFAKAAHSLKTEGWTSHPELACFGSWGEVQAYVEGDAQGDELALMVKLVDDYGVPTILRAVDKMPPEHLADLIISTAHKAKGREWESVKLAGDFLVDDKTSPEELRLLYVALTRARLRLDVTLVPYLAQPPRPSESVLPGVG